MVDKKSKKYSKYSQRSTLANEIGQTEINQRQHKRKKAQMNDLPSKPTVALLLIYTENNASVKVVLLLSKFEF